MKILSIRSTPLYDVEFTAADVALMITSAEHHYDAHCKATAQYGGILYGLLNMVSDGEPTAGRMLSRTELDLLCKVTESLEAPLATELRNLLTPPAGKTRIDRLKLAIGDLTAAYESLEDACVELRKIGLDGEAIRGGMDIRFLRNAVEGLAEHLENKVECPDCGHKLALHAPACTGTTPWRLPCNCDCSWAGVLT